MNRSSRSKLNQHIKRAFASLILSLITILSYGQIANCPTGIVNLNVDDGTNCTADFTVSPSIGASGTATFTSIGATTVVAPTSFSMLEGFAFDYGITEVTILDNMSSCTFTIVNSTATVPFLDVCDDVTVDLAGQCLVDFSLPATFTQSGSSVCEAGNITFSFSDINPNNNTLTLDATNLGSIVAQVYLTKGTDQGSCTKTITSIDSNPTTAGIGCPSNISVEVAPTCQYVYTFGINDTIPCGGSLVQLAGPPNSSAIPLGLTTYTFEVRDAAGMGQSSCSWTVTVTESANAGAQVNCLSAVNISIDQTCEAVVDPFTFVTGQICGDISLYSLSATLPTGEELSGPSITFTQEQVGTEIDVTVFDPNGINSCWSRVTIEDKLAPLIACPPDVTVTCLEPIDTSATGLPMLLTGTLPETELQNATISNGSCVVDLFFGDAIQELECSGAFQRIITRTFYVVDNAGNRSENCSQTISVTRETLASTIFPEHFDGIDGPHEGLDDNGVLSNPALACDGQDIFWASELTENGHIVPSPYDSITPMGDTIPGTGAPSGIGSCGTIFSFYEDLIVDVCEEECANFNPSFKVLRTWDIFDWCTGEMLIHEQLIKVIDSVPPVFTIGVPDLTVSTDIWGCGATIDLPEVLAEDNCATDISYSWYIDNGTYDAVLNKVYVADNALTEEGEEILLVAFAEDCCGNMVSDTGYVTIIDAVPPVAVADEHTTISLNNQEDDGSTKVSADSFDDGSWDNCSPVDWWVRRMDNACEGYDGLNSSGGVDPNEVDEVNDFHKYIHFCCEDVEEEQRVIFMVCDDGDRDGIVEMNGDDNCTTAMIIVDVQDKLAPTVVCPNPVTINCIEFEVYQDYLDVELTDEQTDKLNVRFGEAYATSTCVILGEQVLAGNEMCGTGSIIRTFVVSNSNGQASCNQTIVVEAEPENILSCSDISFPTLSKSPNNYSWCDPADQVAPFVKPVVVDGCGSINLEEPLIDRDDLCTEVGINLTLDTFNFAQGGCMKILAHWEVIDQCIFSENYFDENGDEVDPFVEENGYFELYVEYDIFDTDAPVIECESVLVDTEDCEFNFGSFSVSATDECTPASALSYTYKVDYNADGVYDYPSDAPFAEGDAFDASIVGGLPIGKHAIKWVVSDGCGNFETCLQEIEVVQRIKEPTPYCYLGLSSAVMDSVYGCSVEFWAVDFVPDQTMGACGEELTYLMIPYQDIFGDPSDPEDDLSPDDALDLAKGSWEFGCEYIENGEQHVIEIRIYAVDENGIYDFCDASLTLNDNFDCCQDIAEGTTFVSGNVMTEKGTVMKDVEIRLDGDSPELPISLFSTPEGNFTFYGLKLEEDYRISAHYNVDALQGVSTLDLVLIQRHILGMTELNSPYKLIAADINGNESISVVDLLQLRKLILGRYEDDNFPNNTSWRFLDDGYKFVDNKRPFPFNEVIHVDELAQSTFNQNFVAVKIGDVNNSFQASSQYDSDVRSEKSYKFLADDLSFETGSMVEVPVKASESKGMYGFQFSLNFSQNEIENLTIISGGLTVEEANYAVENGVLKASWSSAEMVNVLEDEVLFKIVFQAKANGTVSNSIQLNDQALNAEIYDESFETSNLGLSFRSLEGADFELLQNEPNPFSAETRIHFNLPSSGAVNFKVFDITGKLLMSKTGEYPKGRNTINVQASDFDVDGILYYQIDFNGQQLTKKMILVE
jgi:hypothetical protein